MLRIPTFDLDRDNTVLFYSQLFLHIGIGLQIVLWPLYIVSLGASPVQVGLVIGGAAILRTILVIPAGALSDRVSTRTIILFTTAMMVPGGAIIAAAQIWWQALIGALFLELAGVGIPAISSHIAGAAATARRTHAFNMVFSVAAGAGVLVGPPIGGLIAGLATLRLVFVLAVLAYAISALLVYFLRDISPRNSDGDPGESDSRTSNGYLDVLRMPTVVSISALHALVPLALSTGTVLLPLFLEEVRDVSVTQLGVLGAISAAGGISLGLVAGRVPYLKQPFVGMIVTVLLTMTAFVLLRTTDMVILIGLAFLLRGTYNVVWSMMASALSEVTPEHKRGRAYGLAEFGAGIGDTAAPLLAGWLYATRETLPLDVAIAACLPLLAVMGLSAWLANRRFGIQTT